MKRRTALFLELHLFASQHRPAPFQCPKEFPAITRQLDHPHHHPDLHHLDHCPPSPDPYRPSLPPQHHHHPPSGTSTLFCQSWYSFPNSVMAVLSLISFQFAKSLCFWQCLVLGRRFQGSPFCLFRGAILWNSFC